MRSQKCVARTEQCNTLGTMIIIRNHEKDLVTFYTSQYRTPELRRIAIRKKIKKMNLDVMNMELT